MTNTNWEPIHQGGILCYRKYQPKQRGSAWMYDATAIVTPDKYGATLNIFCQGEIEFSEHCPSISLAKRMATKLFNA